MNLALSSSQLSTRAARQALPAAPCVAPWHSSARPSSCRAPLELASASCSSYHRAWQPQRSHVRCRAEEENVQKLPEGVMFELGSGSGGEEEGPSNSIEYDEETKTMRIPISALQGDAASRRTRLVTFTCNKCGGRTTRAVNPIAWKKGMVYGQCGTCSVWHVLAANNPKIYEEINYKELAQAEAAAAAAAPDGGAGQQS